MDFDNKTVYILDSYGLIYRCYYAFISRPMINSKGQNVSATFGFFKSLAQIFKHYKPNYLIAALDSKTPTFRHKMYTEYKATRDKTPEDLFAQIDVIEEFLKVLNVPTIRLDGYEADDLIATFVKKCNEQGHPCRILSADKDLMQLVDENTQILKPSKDNTGAGWEVIAENGVKAEWGVEPKRLLDLLSLMGDSADNVPGCPGIGIKTGLKLLQEYNDLDGIFSHVDEIKGALGQKLRDGKEKTQLSKTLITLCDSAPLDFDYEEFLKQGNGCCFAYEDLAKTLSQNEFPAVSKSFYELAKGSSSSSKTKKDEQNLFEEPETPSTQEELISLKKNEGNYKTITSTQELSNFIQNVIDTNKIVAYDSETNGLDTCSAKIIGFSLSNKAGEGIYVPLATQDSLLFSDFMEKQDAFTQLQKLLNNPEITVIFHNAKFDYKILVTNGFDFKSDKPQCKIVDTMIAAWLLSPDSLGRNSYSLEKLAEKKLGLVGTDFDEIVPKGQTFDSVPIDVATKYAAEDADFTFSLWQILQPELEKQGLYDLFINLEMKLLPILARMELNGIHLDSENLKNYSVELTQKIQNAEKEIFELVGHEFNIASTKQLQEVLFTERGLPHGKKTKLGYSTDTSVLEELAEIDPVPKKILEYRELAKLLSTYVEALPKLADKNGRIHTDFIQTGTATGRLSCREPNLQNIPVRNDAGRKIRSAFTSTKDTVLISADYSQIELVVLAHLSQDQNMTNAFKNGVDIHKATASLIFGVSEEQVTPQMRRTAKTINFGVIYGMSAFRLAKDLGISRTEASNFIQTYFEKYSSIRNFMDTTIQNAEQTGYVTTLMGRKRQILSINSRNKLEKSGAERMAINTPVQGSAADIVKQAMIQIDQALKEENSNAKLLLQVHDELIFECPNDQSIIDKTIEIIKNRMENVVELLVPLKVSIEYGKNWGEFH